MSLALVLDGAASVRLSVYDALGREVAVVLDGPLGAGTHRAVFDGAALPAGVYVARAAVAPESGAGAQALVRRFDPRPLDPCDDSTKRSGSGRRGYAHSLRVAPPLRPPTYQR